jgi:hypothetical protein
MKKFFALIKTLFWAFKGGFCLEKPEKPFDTELYVKKELISLGHMLGLDYESLISSFELAKKGIDNSNPRIQDAAIEALNYFWPKDEEVAEKCMTLLQSDADEGVKGACISYLINYFDRASKEDPIVKLLARIVSGKDHEEVKSFAYLGINRLLYGFRLRDDPLTFSFARDVNWKLVNTLNQS